MSVPRDISDMIPHKFFEKGGVCKNSLGGDMHSHERLLVYIVICTRMSAVVFYLLSVVGLLNSHKYHTGTE